MQRILLILLFFYSCSAFAEDTVLKLYRPFGEVIDQNPIVIKNKYAGQCLAQSQLIIREDAWRCLAEGKLFDPCFLSQTGKHMEVVCPQSPWIGDSVTIELSAPLTNEHQIPLDMSRAFPWGIELANGVRCQAIVPQTSYDSLPIRYQCSDNNSLIGRIQRCNPVWSMIEKTSQGTTTVELIKAWF